MTPHPRKFAPGVVVAGVALLAFGAAAQAAPVLTFDNFIAAGTISHSVGGPVVGTGITFDFIEATDVPVNAGITTCNNCVLEFTSGPLVSEGPDIWEWGSGGTFVITGEFATSGPGATLLSGTFDQATATFTSPMGIPQIAITGFGLDQKHPAIFDFYELDVLIPFVFASTNIAADNPTVDSSGAFSGTVTEGDVTNTQTSVPEPSTALLLLFGASCVAAARRRA